MADRVDEHVEMSAAEADLATPEGRRKWLKLDEASAERAWEGALEHLRAKGKDPDAMLDAAGKNLSHRLHAGDDADLDAPIGEGDDTITLREVMALSEDLAAHPETNPVTLVWHGESEDVPRPDTGGTPS